MVLTGAPYVQRLVDQGALPTTDYNTEWIGGCMFYHYLEQSNHFH